MYARPRFFAKVMGELLFWVGEDKMLFGSDYGIWEPKWQIDGLPRLGLPPARSRGVLGLPAPRRRRQAQDPGAQRRQAVRHRGPRGHGPSPTPRPRTTRSWSKPDEHPGLPRTGGRIAPPLAPPPPHRRRTARGYASRSSTRWAPSMTPSSMSRSRAALHHLVRGQPARRRGRRPAPAHAAVRAQLRLPDGGGCPPRGAVGAGRARRHGRVGGPLHRRGDQRALSRGQGFTGAFPGRDRR